MDVRLKTVAHLIRSAVHADVGSDHAQLIAFLLRCGRIKRGIAIENKAQPYRNSKKNLAGLAADVWFSDGLENLDTNEVGSLSICGMGGESIVKILESHPDRVPQTIVLQPNRRGDLVRQWGLRAGFHISDEQIAWGYWPYEIMKFERADKTSRDPAYSDVDLNAALLFGPLILRRREDRFINRLREEQVYLSQFKKLKQLGRDRLSLIDYVLGQQCVSGSRQE